MPDNCLACRFERYMDKGYNGNLVCFAFVAMIAAMNPAPARAQALTPVPGYLLPDMVDTGHFALALTDGRYRAEAPAGCADFTTYQNVTVWLSDDTPSQVVITPPDAIEPTCYANVLSK